MTIQTPSEIRTATLADLRELAASLFAAKPEYRSLMMAIAQVPAGSSEHEVHAQLIASVRDLPLWPHPCIPGEACVACGDAMAGTLDALPFDETGTAIDGFAAFCHEDGGWGQEHAESFLPYAVARRVGDAVEVEVIGTVQRPAQELAEQHWSHPLGAVVAACSTRIIRGVLREVEVYVTDDEVLATVRGASAWSTVEVLRFLPGSIDLIDPAMTALREVGPVGTGGLEVIAEVPRPWAIEALEAVIDDDSDLDLLRAATTLPRLRRLALGGNELDDAVMTLPSADWWSQLERLTVSDRDATPLATWQARLGELAPLRWLAIVQVDEFDDSPAGWEIAFGPDRACEITMQAWRPDATLDALVARIDTLPPDVAVTLRPSRYWSPSHVDVEYLAAATERVVSLGA